MNPARGNLKLAVTKPLPGDQLRCAIYARKSNEDDASDELRSVARQVAHARDYATGKGWRVDEALIFVDDGISGAEFERRPGLVRLLNVAEAGSLDVLVVASSCRLGREMVQTSRVLTDLARAHVEVWFYLDNRRAELDTATGKLVEHLHCFGSELERERTRQRTLDGMLKRAQAGYSTGGRVYGYRRHPVYASGRQDANGHPVPDYVDRQIDPAEAKVVVGIYEMYIDGYGFTAIAKTLNGHPRRAAELQKYFGGICPPSPRNGTGSWAPTCVREILHRSSLLYIGQVVWGATRRDGTPDGRILKVTPAVVVERPDLRIVKQELWDAVQARLKERAEAYLRQTGGKFYGRPESSRESRYLFSGFLQCAQCGAAMVVGRRTYNPPRSWYVCSYHLKRGDTVCSNGVGIPVDELDTALLDEIERKVLTPEALTYLVTKAEEAILQSLAQDPEQIESLRKRRMDTQRKVTRLVEAVAEGQPPKSLLVQITAFERQLEQMDQEIAGLEARARLGQLDVARALRELEPALAAWRGILRGNPVRARQILRKLIEKPIVMEPLPEVHGYRWRGELNGGAVLEGARQFGYRWCRGPEPMGIITWKHELLVVAFSGEWTVAA